ncbi:MAG: YicC family protein [Spirochaetes bacterium]|nr:YicC family protein [Spirochaetota bacterium]
MKSMTGYSSIERVLGKYKFTLEIKSVNNRFSEFSVRMPYFLNHFEKDIKDLLRKNINRGKVDVFISTANTDPEIKISVNEKLAMSYYNAFLKIKKITNANSNIPLNTIINSDGVFSIEKKIDNEDIWKKLKKILNEAIKDFDKVRSHDGESVMNDLKAILGKMKKTLTSIKLKTNNAIKRYQKVIEKKLNDLVEKNFDSERILAEAGILAVKADINEEISRLESHFKLFENNLKLKGAVGKTLDFICQEMNREINTIGSKQAVYEISEKVIILKSELEKLREQVRNIE